MRVDGFPLNPRARGAILTGVLVLALGVVTPTGLATAAPRDRTAPTARDAEPDAMRRLAERVVGRALDPLRTDQPAVGHRPVTARDAVAAASARERPAELAEAPPAPTVRETIADRCPDLTDPELLRDGAAADGHGLCVRSVHAARSDHAASAIVEGFGLLGLPYSRGRRGQDGYDDCSSFVGRAYREAGRPLSDSDWEPSSSVMRDASWATVVDEARPGDILWRRGHVAMALVDGYLMHASQSGDVTHVEEVGRYRRVLAVDAAPLV